MNYIFWNTNGKDHTQYIHDIVAEYGIDFIILAEFPENKIANLIVSLKKIGLFYRVPNIKNKRIYIITKLLTSQITLLPENNYVRFISFLDTDINKQLNFGLLHLPSKLHANEHDMIGPIQATNSIIEDIELKNDLTILIGDFNMNPFEKGMLSSNGFHAFPRKIESNKHKRTVLSDEKKMFYNPMWKYLIKEDDPIGSYYYTSGGAYTLHWHVFDQILIRPQLIPFLNSAEIIGSFENVTFLKNNKPNSDISDHLPVLMKLNMEDV